MTTPPSPERVEEAKLIAGNCLHGAVIHWPDDMEVPQGIGRACRNVTHEDGECAQHDYEPEGIGRACRNVTHEDGECAQHDYEPEREWDTACPWCIA